MEINKILWEHRDAEYAAFQAKLTPTVDADKFIGVRVPELRKLAKEYIKTLECEEFLKILPHEYFDENMLHGLLISEMKDYDRCMTYLDSFLPYVDNWAVCDIMSPKIFKKYKNELMIKIKQWVKSKHVYTCRFGIGMLMSHFLNEDFQPEYLKLATAVKSDEYYINMMIAWYLATALAKQWDDTVILLEAKQLDPWVHNKTIQKARESLRITTEQKAYLKTLKV